MSYPFLFYSLYTWMSGSLLMTWVSLAVITVCTTWLKGVKQLGRGADYSPPSSTVVMNACFFTSPHMSSWYGS
jgi:hypothetical protein